jgi:peptidoglycan/LPS O-acetylase OafA/YrhL
MSAPSSLADRHLPALDGLRGIAILWVLAHQLHLTGVPTGWAAQLARPLEAGWIGVQLFFVLSGFLITGILLDTQHRSDQLRNFYTRRVLRIFPLYYGSLFVALVLLPHVVWPALGRPTDAFTDDLAYQGWLWTYLSNWTPLREDIRTHFFPHFWSLAVEEQFYLVWPLLIRHRSARTVLGLSLALALVSLLVRIVMRPHELAEYAIYSYTQCRMDALALGAAAAACARLPAVNAWWRTRHVWLSRGAWAMVLGGAVITRGYPQYAPLTQTLGYTLLALAFAAWLYGLALEQVQSLPARHALLTAGWLRRVGRVSYGMYVFHYPLHFAVGLPLLAALGLAKPFPLWLNLFYLLAMTLALFGLASLSYRWIEQPLLSLKNRWAPRGALATS